VLPVHAGFDQLPISQRVDARAGQLDIDAAALAASAHQIRNDDLVSTSIDELQGLDTKVLPNLIDLLDEAAKAIVARIRRG
jgi:hypothetical protein